MLDLGLVERNYSLCLCSILMKGLDFTLIITKPKLLFIFRYFYVEEGGVGGGDECEGDFEGIGPGCKL